MEINSFKISFERTFTQLINLCDQIERRKHLCAKICQDCQQLSRPWPKTKSELGKLTSRVSSSALEKSEVLPGDGLTAKDLEELKLVEEALRKAGKTRRLYKTEFKESDNASELSAPISNLSAAESAESVVSANLSAKEQAKQTNSHTRSHKTERYTDTGLRSSNSAKGQGRAAKSRCQNAATGEGSSNVAVISQNALDALRTSALSKSKSSNALSSVKFKPAHASAPFLTTSTTKSSSRNFQTQKSSKGSSSQLSRNLDRPASISRLERCSSNSYSQKLSTDMRNLRLKTSLSVAGNSSASVDQTVQTESRVEEIHEETLTKIAFNDNLNHEICSESVDDNTVVMQSEINDTSFLLFRDGSSLKLPSELDQALAKNYRLRAKLKSSFGGQRRLREGESSAENFCELLQRHVDDCGSDSLTQSRECYRISNFLLWLKSLLELATSIDVSDNCSIEVIVQAQKIVDYVLGEFSNLEDMLKSVHLQQWNSDGKAIGGGIEVTPTPKDFSLNWFINDKHHFDYECKVKLNSSSRLKYQTEQQLHRYTTLVHQVQLLQVQFMMLTNVGRDAVVLLNQLSPSDRLFPLLYRSFYSLICSYGRNFPAVVRVIADDDDEDQESSAKALPT